MREQGFPLSAADVSFWRDAKGTHGRLKGRGFEISSTSYQYGYVLRTALYRRK